LNPSKAKNKREILGIITSPFYLGMFKIKSCQCHVVGEEEKNMKWKAPIEGDLGNPSPFFVVPFYSTSWSYTIYLNPTKLK